MSSFGQKITRHAKHSRGKKKKKRTGSVMTQMLVSSHRDLKITTINVLRDLMLKSNKTLDHARDGNS